MAVQGLGRAGAVIASADMPGAGEMLSYWEKKQAAEQEARAQAQRQEEQRKNELMTYLGQNFDRKNFATALHDQVGATVGKYAEAIANAQGVNKAQLYSAMQGDLQQLGAYSNRINEVLADNKARAADYKTYKGIDAHSLERLANNNALYKRGENGALVLKSVEELEAERDRNYVDDIINGDEGRLVLSGELSTGDYLGELKTFKGVKKYRRRGRDGRTVQDDYEVELFPFQEVDESGEEPVVRTRFQNSEGQPQATEEDYRDFIKDPRNRIWLNKYFDEYVQQKGFSLSGKPLDKYSQVGEEIKRLMVYDKLSGIREKTFKKVDAVMDRPINIRVGAGAKEDKVDTKLELLVGAASGDPSILSQGVQAGDGTIDVLPAVGGSWKIPDGAGGFYTTNSIVVDPQRPGVFRVDYSWKVKNPDGSDGVATDSKTYIGQDFVTFLQNSAQANGPVGKTQATLGKRAAALRKQLDERVMESGRNPKVDAKKPVTVFGIPLWQPR